MTPGAGLARRRVILKLAGGDAFDHALGAGAGRLEHAGSERVKETREELTGTSCSRRSVLTWRAFKGGGGPDPWKEEGSAARRAFQSF